MISGVVEPSVLRVFVDCIENVATKTPVHRIYVVVVFVVEIKKLVLENGAGAVIAFVVSLVELLPESSWDHF